MTTTAGKASHNVGGIMVSDGGFGIPVGPATHNLVADNVSSDNAFDCGITLPGHDPLAVATSGSNAGRPQPSIAGVYSTPSSTMWRRTMVAPGSSTPRPTRVPPPYDNLFAPNIVTGNGNAGFTLHAHAPDQDVSGFVVRDNVFGPDNLSGDPDTGVSATTGIMLLSVAVPTSVVVAGNTVFDDVNGIASNADITVAGHNRFVDVTNPLATYTPLTS